MVRQLIEKKGAREETEEYDSQAQLQKVKAPLIWKQSKIKASLFWKQSLTTHNILPCLFNAFINTTTLVVLKIYIYQTCKGLLKPWRAKWKKKPGTPLDFLE